MAPHGSGLGVQRTAKAARPETPPASFLILLDLSLQPAVRTLLAFQTHRMPVHSRLQALAQAVHSPKHPSSRALPPVPRAWLVEKLPTLDLRVFQQEQESVANRGADCHRPSEQQINDRHQQVLVSELCVRVLLLLGETRQRGSENTGCREERPSTARFGVQHSKL